MLKLFNAPPFAAVVSVPAFVTAAVVGALVVFLSGVPDVKAGWQIETAVDHPGAKGDRLAVLVKGGSCSSVGWPHYEQSCRFDLRRPADDMRTVRVVALR
jgi:hypothetical protein